MKVKCKLLSDDAILPEKKSSQAAGFDLYSIEDTVIEPGNLSMVKTGVALEIPWAYEGQIRPRSSLGAQGIIIPNSPGTIDSDYRGEIKILLMNLSSTQFKISKGDRIAQIIFARLSATAIKEVVELNETARGKGGFGSTGRR